MLEFNRDIPPWGSSPMLCYPRVVTVFMCDKNGFGDLGLWLGLFDAPGIEKSTPTLFSTEITLWSSSIKFICNSCLSSLQCFIWRWRRQFSAFCLVAFFWTCLSSSSMSPFSCLLTSWMVCLVANSTAFFSDLTLYCSYLAATNSSFISMMRLSRSSTRELIPYWLPRVEVRDGLW